MKISADAYEFLKNIGETEPECDSTGGRLATSLSFHYIYHLNKYVIKITVFVQKGSIVDPAAATPLLELCGMGYDANIETSMTFLMSHSYLRYGIVSPTVLLYRQTGW